MSKQRQYTSASPDSDAQVHIQLASKTRDVPRVRDITTWVRSALAGHQTQYEVTVRIVDEEEGAALNRRYRQGARATNVLSFSLPPPVGITHALLGDIVICAPVVEREAVEQGKARRAHWAHMVVHGTLHLLGYDHDTVDEAYTMESLECRILAQLGFPDPYLEQ
jgi:probable rRNA maturation factor